MDARLVHGRAFQPQLGLGVRINQAAQLLGVALRRTVYYRIREGRLQTIRTRGGSPRVLLWSVQQQRLTV